jgi:replicative DNA helicase
MQQGYEDRFLSALNTVEDLSEATLAGITSDTLVIRREVFQFIIKYVSKYQSFPARDLIELEFSDFKYMDGVKSEERQFLIKELIKSEVRRKVINIMDKSSTMVHKDTYGAIDFIQDQISKVKKPVSSSKSYTDREALSRLTKLRERKEKLKKGGIIGIKTGLSFFDEKLLGWQPGNLIAIIARLNVGKSTLGTYLSCFSYSEGYRVAYLSPEMSTDEEELKWDTTMGALMGYKFSTSGLMRGEVDEVAYEEFLTKMSERKDWLTMDSVNNRPFSIATIETIIDEFSPDLVVVDGFLLLNIGDKSPQNMERAANDLKSLALSRKVVLLVTSQANRQAATNEMPEMHQVYGTDALGHAADVVIMMADDETKPNKRWVSIAKRRMGAGINKKELINFSVDLGVIG